MKYALILLFTVMMTPTSIASRWYVSPAGASSDPGTYDAPWDIASALGGESNVKPGDTIVLLEGTYRRRPKELYEIRLVGTAEAPIHIRAEQGKRVCIDGGLSMQSPSSHVWVWDLEILVSEPTPEEPVSPGSHPEDLARPWGGLHMFGGNNCKYINLVIHSCNQGISCWKGEIDPEIYGCIIYGNGWLGADRGHGHCIYTQNDEGVKTISNSIMTCPYDGSYTVHAYGSDRAYINNFLLQENVCYSRGPFLVGGGRSSHNIRVLRNYLYGVDMRIGYTAPYNQNCEIRDNVIVNGALNITRYQQATQQGNLIVARNQERPEGTKSVLLPNRDDENRAHLAVYNWSRAESVEVNVASFLKNGELYRLMNPQDFFGQPIARGECEGETIRVPVKGEFGVFVVLKNN